MSTCLLIIATFLFAMSGDGQKIQTWLVQNLFTSCHRRFATRYETLMLAYRRVTTRYHGYPSHHLLAVESRINSDVSSSRFTSPLFLLGSCQGGFV